MSSERNYQVLNIQGAKPIKAWTRGVMFDEKAQEQVINVARLPFIFRWVAVMPDVHWGMGATIGSVIPTDGAIVPAAVGVDIGCGMMAQKTNLRAEDLPDNLRPVRTAIEEAVPHGRTHNGGPNDRGAWGTLPDPVARAWAGLRDGLEQLTKKHPKLKGANSANHLGTLGTGNHFIEVCLDQADAVWLMLHSGSRGIGNRIGTYFIDQAKKQMKTWRIELPDPNLAYLPQGVELFKDYLHGARWAQEFARINRELMMEAVLGGVRGLKGLEALAPEGAAVNCHHNYVAMEHHYGQNVWITRKGAVRARQGDLGIIPGSMGARSYIVQGKGNPESFESCSHGAGRLMSRGEARRRFSIKQHAAATAQVECRKDADVLDETPGAYKSIDQVMRAQADLVEIRHTLRQIVCVKG